MHWNETSHCISRIDRYRHSIRIRFQCSQFNRNRICYSRKTQFPTIEKTKQKQTNRLLSLSHSPLHLFPFLSLADMSWDCDASRIWFHSHGKKLISQKPHHNNLIYWQLDPVDWVSCYERITVFDQSCSQSEPVPNTHPSLHLSCSNVLDGINLEK